MVKDVGEMCGCVRGVGDVRAWETRLRCRRDEAGTWGRRGLDVGETRFGRGGDKVRTWERRGRGVVGRGGAVGG